MKRLIAVLFASTLLLAACGSSDSAGSGSSAKPGDNFNDADIAFAQGMIPHHQQAVEMADLALTRAESPEVTSLAKQIKAAQDPEIKTMTGWLKTWGAPLTADTESSMDHMDDADDSASEGTGMMSASEMTNLKKAKGAAFDTMFLEMMIQHHTGAITQAKTEQAEGKNSDAKALAGGIIKAQKAEISTMEGLLDTGN